MQRRWASPTAIECACSPPSARSNWTRRCPTDCVAGWWWSTTVGVQGYSTLAAGPPQSYGVNRNLLVGGESIDPLSQTSTLSSTYVGLNGCSLSSPNVRSGRSTYWFAPGRPQARSVSSVWISGRYTAVILDRRRRPWCWMPCRVRRRSSLQRQPLRSLTPGRLSAPHRVRTLRRIGRTERRVGRNRGYP